MGKVKLSAEHRYVAELELPQECDLSAKDRRQALTASLKSAGYPDPRRIRATRITHIATGTVVSEKERGS